MDDLGGSNTSVKEVTADVVETVRKVEQINDLEERMVETSAVEIIIIIKRNENSPETSGTTLNRPTFEL